MFAIVVSEEIKDDPMVNTLSWGSQMMSKTIAATAVLFCFAAISKAGRATDRPAPLDEQSVRAPGAHLELQVLVQLKYRCTVPASVPAHVDWHHDGQPILVDGPSIYQHHHRDGWGEYLFFFLSDGVDVLTDDSDTLTFVAGPRFVNSKPRNDGYTQCRSQLRTLVKQYGAQRVKAVIENRLEEIQKDLEIPE